MVFLKKNYSLPTGVPGNTNDEVRLLKLVQMCVQVCFPGRIFTRDAFIVALG